jgi:hypothetical protein
MALTGFVARVPSFTPLLANEEKTSIINLALAIRNHARL